MSDFRALPSVDQLLQSELIPTWIDRFGRPLVVDALREALALARAGIQTGQPLPSNEILLENARHLLETWLTPSLRPVINASGVVLHTNLGRAPLSRASLDAIQQTASTYSTLEYDLAHGSRGSRNIHAEALLKRLTGADAALVVNNNAAAVLLALTALAKRKRVIISRTQLVEIGGGFRIPDVMAQSGAQLVEVGTTNRVHLSDYETALETPAAFILHAHTSNFRIIGFTSEPALAEIGKLAHRQGLLFMDDLGSGALLDTARYGLAHEPTVQESLVAGADLVCFSGDKLLGGPQAGILVGKAELIAKIKKHPLSRAVRADKLCLAALTATLQHYLKGEAEQQIPIWRFMAQTQPQLEARATRWASQLGQGEVIAGFSTIGGGSLPEESMPTSLLALKVRHPNHFLSRLRQADPPVIAYVGNDLVLLDPRTVLPEQENDLLNALRTIIQK
ncbi:MAG TPA: L-seryl-tRNA(Sec) selenium transferase [Longilinea sp.]|nr:L-seryl-tRNA(Sec) selenium transferase [Longilinea sp.]